VKSAAALILFVLLSLVMTWPLATQLDSGLPGNLGDPLLNSWILERNYQKLLDGDISSFFEANIFYPSSLVLAFSEHLLAPTLLTLPIYLVSGNVLLSYNLLLLLSFALSGWGAYLLVKDLCGEEAPAIFAGILFAFFPFRFYHLGHLHLLSSQWIPLVLLYLHRYLDRRGLRNLLLLGLFFVLQFLSCGYHGLYLSLFVAIFTIYHFARLRRLPDRACCTQLAMLGALMLLMIVPVLLPYVAAKQQLGLQRHINDAIGASADLLAYAQAPLLNRLWGPLTGKLGMGGGALFPGLLALLLAIVGARAIRRERTPSTMVSFALWMTLLGLILSFGPVLKIGGKRTFPMLYQLLYDGLPGFSGLRQVAVISFFFSLGLAILAAYGLRALSGKRRWLPIVAIVVALAEFASVPLPVATVPDAPPVYAWLATQPAAPLVEYPMTRSADYQYLYYSSIHRHDLLNGVSGYFPSWYWQSEQLMQRFPSAETLDLLEGLGVRRVIVHLDRLDAQQRKTVLAGLPRFADRLTPEHQLGQARSYLLTRTLRLSRRQIERRWYSTAKTYQAAYLPGAIGRLVGSERRARRGERGVLSFGPYVSLPAGRYEVSFKLRVDFDRHSLGKIYGRLRVSTQSGTQIAERPLLRSDFPNGPAMRSITLPFTLDATTQMRKLEFSVSSTGVSPLRISRIQLKPLR